MTKPMQKQAETPGARSDTDDMEQSRLMLPWHVRFFRVIAPPFFRALFHLLTRVELEGLENVPSKGGYLVASNHVSIFEPPALAVFWPRPLEIVGAVDVLNRPVQGQIMKLYGTLEVHRGQADRSLLMAVIKRLKSGLPVLIFPEGGRSHTPGLREGWTGSAYVAAKADVPVVPVGITGTESLVDKLKQFKRTRLHIRVGRPLRLPGVPFRSAARKQALQKNTDKIMQAIAALLPPSHQGVYIHDG
jgi:1-acyl-sn-glycerol-3-phosphate acyltransferase